MTAARIAAIALDLGTMSVKAGVLNQDGALVHIVTNPAPEISANAGRYESDVLLMWRLPSGCWMNAA